MPMEALPIELKLNILSIALDVHPIPSNILRVHSSFNRALGPILHTHIRLLTLDQLYAFAKAARLSRNPKTFSLRLPGGTTIFPRRAEQNNATAHTIGTPAGPGMTGMGVTVPSHLSSILSSSPHTESIFRPKDSELSRMKIVDNGGIWGCLAAALRNCKNVEHVFLRLNSFVSDPNLGMVATALSVINPITFTWMGPDPDHHISTAIISKAAEHLFRAMKSWTNLVQLTLCNIQFPPASGPSLINAFSFHTHKLLRDIHLGQAVFLQPMEIASLVTNVPSLQNVTLEDAYVASIWGRRVRDTDILSVYHYLNDDDPRKIRLGNVVTCTVRLERIIGGDRG